MSLIHFLKKLFSVIFHIFLVVYRNRNTDRNAFICLPVIFERTRFPRPVIFRGLLGQRGMLMTFLKSFFCSRAPSHFTITDKFSSTMAELRSWVFSASLNLKIFMRISALCSQVHSLAYSTKDRAFAFSGGSFNFKMCTFARTLWDLPLLRLWILSTPSFSIFHCWTWALILATSAQWCPLLPGVHFSWLFLGSMP